MRPILATALASTLAVCALQAQAPPPAPPAVSGFTAPAQGDLKYNGKRLMVLFFDTTGTSAADQQRSQQAALKFINTQMSATDMVAIMSDTTGVNILQDFSSDRATLADVINKMQIRDNAAADQSESQLASRKLAALDSAANMLGVIPEKKSLVYFASGMTRTGTDNQAQLSATIKSAVKNNVAFYPVDASGIVAGATN